MRNPIHEKRSIILIVYKSGKCCLHGKVKVSDPQSNQNTLDGLRSFQC